MATILVVEDEPTIARGVRDLLAFHGHTPIVSSDGESGLAVALGQDFDLMVLDIMLPKISGTDICRQVRAAKPTQAIIMLTALGEDEHVIAGFDAGCDDYLAKPFSMAVFVARVDALLRRAINAASIDKMSIGDIVLDTNSLTLTGKLAELPLTVRESDVLEFFIGKPKAVVSRNEILRAVWGYENPDKLETRCVDVHIANLRKKLKQVSASVAIDTVRGAGYRLLCS